MLKICYGCMRPKESSPICEGCGYDERSQNSDHQLPVGTKVGGQYVLGKVLGQGGFGITYIGWDTALHIPVAVKEYFPSGYAGRSTRSPLQVTAYDNPNCHDFQKNKQRFLREAESLSRLWNIPQIVRVLRHFEENGTAYIAMEYVEGMDLRKYLKQLGRPMTMEEVLTVLGPIMEALIHVHRADLVHRDISPDNIMVMPNGGAKLLDFGAARYVESPDAAQERNTSTQAILKHGFAPPEQYRSHGALGPWTDIYAMCATIYYCLTGSVPPEAMSRMMEHGDKVWDHVPGLTARQRAALEKGMALQPEQRYATIGQLREALGAETVQTAVRTNAVSTTPKTKKPGKKKKWPAIAAAMLTIAAGICAAVGYYLYTTAPALDIADSLNWVGVEENHSEVIPILSDHTYSDITWSSSDPQIATVTDHGLVRAVGNGGVQITATYKNQSDICYVMIEFKPDSPFTYEKKHSGLVITGYVGDLPKDIVIPQTIKDIPVIEIGENAFSRCTNLSSITIPNGITTIGADAFSYCTNLSTLSLPSSVRSIGNYAFRGCRNLSTVYIPLNVKSIGMYAFFDTKLSGRVTISKDCKIGEKAFPARCSISNRHY